MSSERPGRLEHPKVRTALWVAGSLALTVLAVGAIFLTTGIYELVTSVRATQVDNTERQELDRQRDQKTAATAADAARSADRIEDCTTPGRACFEAAQRRTGQAVAGINRGTLDVIVAALSCQADGIIDQRPLARCTARRAQSVTVGDSPPTQEKR